MIPTSKTYEDDQLALMQEEAFRARRSCRWCRGQGVTFDRDGPVVRSEQCLCVRRVNLEHLLRAGNVPRDFWERPTFLGDDDPVAVSWAAGAPPGVLLAGEYGVGKTSRACWALRRAAERGLSVFRVEAAEVERALSLVKSSQWWVDRWLQRGLFADVLSLDELGTEAVRGVCGREARTVISYALKHRVENQMQTYVCTNLDRAQLAEHYGDATASVVFGNRFTIIPLDRGDRRQ